jgi:hypothetical protein
MFHDCRKVDSAKGFDLVWLFRKVTHVGDHRVGESGGRRDVCAELEIYLTMVAVSLEERHSSSSFTHVARTLHSIPATRLTSLHRKPTRSCRLPAGILGAVRPEEGADLQSSSFRSVFSGDQKGVVVLW